MSSAQAITVRKMSTPQEVSARLRQIRTQQSLTLKQVEIRSRGVWKAVVVGSYERGDRSLSVAKAKELCEFYGVPLSALFSSAENSNPSVNFDTRPLNRVRIDLRKLRELSSLPDDFTLLLQRYLSQIAQQRDDWNGEILTLRKTDMNLIGLLTQKTEDELLSALKLRKLLL